MKPYIFNNSIMVKKILEYGVFYLQIDSLSRRRKWQPTSVFLSEESHGQRSLVGYSPWGSKELDMTE